MTVTKARVGIVEDDFIFSYLLRASAPKSFQADFRIKIFVDFLDNFFPKMIHSLVPDPVDLGLPAITNPPSSTLSNCESMTYSRKVALIA